MFALTARHYIWALVRPVMVVGFVLIASQAHATVQIDNLNTGNITGCQFGFIPIQGNQYRIRAPGVADAAHPHRGQCSNNYYYGIGNEHDYSNTADIGNAGDVISLVRTNWLDQALTINLVNDSSVMYFVYDGIDNDIAVNSHGLGGIDFTANQDNILRIRLLTSTAEATARVTFYEDDTNYSFIDLSIPNTENSYQNMDLFLADFQDVGTGADWSAVNSVEFEFINTPTLSGTGVYPGQLISNVGIWTAICDVIGTQCQELHHALGVDQIEVNKQLLSTTTVELVDDLDGDGDMDSTATDGDTVRYTVTITNTDDIMDAQASNLTYTASFDPLYASFLPGSVQSDKGTITTGNGVSDNQVAIDVGDLLDGESVTISYDLKVDSGYHDDPGISYSHNGTINADEWAAYDTETVVIDFNQFDISTTLEVQAKDDADSDGLSGAGERVTFTANLTNEGPNTSSSVVFYFPEIANASLVTGSVSSSHGSVTLGNSGAHTEVEVSISNFAAADVATISFDMEIQDPFFFGFFDSVGGQALITDSGDNFSVLSDDPAEAGNADPTYILVDAFPDNVAASVDNDNDGMPDEWNATCDTTCQDNSGLTLDGQLNDTNNDGVANDPDNPLADDDGDGVANGDDAFPFYAEASSDYDGDNMPDTCVNDCIGSNLTLDEDDDNDGVADIEDDFPLNIAAALDSDGDGMPDEWLAACNPSCQEASGLTLDADDDNDGVTDDVDDFPLNAAAATDTDADGMPDEWLETCNQDCQDASGLTLDDDDDNDSVLDVDDAFPLHVAASVDADGDGLPDEWNAGCDVTCQDNSGLTLDSSLNDFDNDGVIDENDAFPLHFAAYDDDDQDGLPDAWNPSCDPTCRLESGLSLDPYPNDTDNDGVDNEPANPLADDDGDGILNGDEEAGFELIDNNPPVVIAPADVTKDSVGTLTSVSLGQASAEDHLDGPLVAVADNRGPFTVGEHIITWTAVDAAGNVGSDTQIVTVLAVEVDDGSGGKGKSSGGGGSLGLFSFLLMFALARMRFTSRRLYS